MNLDVCVWCTFCIHQYTVLCKYVNISQSIVADSLLCQARNSSDTSCEQGKKAIGVEQATVVTLHLMAQVMYAISSTLY